MGVLAVARPPSHRFRSWPTGGPPRITDLHVILLPPTADTIINTLSHMLETRRRRRQGRSRGAHFEQISGVACYISCTARRNPTIKPLHLILFDLPRAMTGTAWAKHEDPHCDPLPLPLLSLLKSRLRLLQTIYRPILHIFRLYPQDLFLLFRGIHATTTPSPPAPTEQGGWDGGTTYDLECVEIWERFARNNQF